MATVQTQYREKLDKIQAAFAKQDVVPTKVGLANIRKLSVELGKLGVDMRKESLDVQSKMPVRKRSSK